jgi:hypothetical protein
LKQGRFFGEPMAAMDTVIDGLVGEERPRLDESLTSVRPTCLIMFRKGERVSHPTFHFWKDLLSTMSEGVEA